MESTHAGADAAETFALDPQALQPSKRDWRAVLSEHRALVIAGSLIAAFLIARLIILFRFQVFTSYDTSSYIRNRAGGGGLLAHPVSFTGRAPRLWGVPLFYSLLPTDHARAVAQWVIGTVAWSVLGVGLWIHMRGVTAKSIVLAASFTLALTPSVARWDYSLLSESLSISLGVLAGGLFAIWVKKTSSLALGGMTLAAFWWMFTRQDVALFAALLAVVVAVYGLRHRGRGRWALVAALVLAMGLGWYAAIVPRIDRSYASWGKGFRIGEATTLYRLRLLVLKDPRMKRIYENRLGMPPCRAAERAAALSGLQMGRFTEAFLSCPDLARWVSENASDNGYRYTLADPKHFARVIVETLPKTLDNDLRVFAKPVPILPGAVSRWIFPRGRFVLPGAFGLIALSVILMAWVRGIQRRAWLLIAGLTLVLASLGNLVVSLVIGWGDFVRYGIQEAILLRIGVIIIVIAAIDAAIDAAITRRRETAAVAASDDQDAAAPI